MAFCSYCGEKVIDGANFCDKCGMRIRKENSLSDSIYPLFETTVGETVTKRCQNCGVLIYDNSGICTACANRARLRQIPRHDNGFSCPCCKSLNIHKISTRKERASRRPMRLFSRRAEEKIGCLFAAVCVIFPPLFVIWLIMQISSLRGKTIAKIKTYQCRKCGYTWEIRKSC